MTQCPTGKQPYPTSNAAWRVIRKMSRQSARYTHARGSEGGHAYQCVHCKEWHITHARRCQTIGPAPYPIAAGIGIGYSFSTQDGTP